MLTSTYIHKWQHTRLNIQCSQILSKTSIIVWTPIPIHWPAKWVQKGTWSPNERKCSENAKFVNKMTTFFDPYSFCEFWRIKSAPNGQLGTLCIHELHIWTYITDQSETFVIFTTVLRKKKKQKDSYFTWKLSSGTPFTVSCVCIHGLIESLLKTMLTV